MLDSSGQDTISDIAVVGMAEKGYVSVELTASGAGLRSRAKTMCRLRFIVKPIR